MSDSAPPAAAAAESACRHEDPEASGDMTTESGSPGGGQGLASSDMADVLSPQTPARGFDAREPAERAAGDDAIETENGVAVVAASPYVAPGTRNGDDDRRW